MTRICSELMQPFEAESSLCKVLSFSNICASGPTRQRKQEPKSDSRW